MKFFHLSDLHIGRRLNDYSLLEDQKEVLAQVVQAAREEKPDCVLIAGDIYDKPVVSEEAVRVFESFIEKLAGLDIPVLAVSGNHDSGPRLSQFSPLLERAGFYINGSPEEGARKVSLSKGGEDVDFYLLPYMFPAQVRRLYPQAEITGFDSALRTLIGKIALDPAHISVILSHQFYQGSTPQETSDSERVMIGGLEQVGADILEKFDYAALGHLHRPQRAGEGQARYAGSIMKYSFSEKNDQKGFIVGELSKDGLATRFQPLTAPRGMREITGKLDEILAREPASSDYVKINLTDASPVASAASKLRDRFENLVEITFTGGSGHEGPRMREEELREVRKDPVELFSRFYKEANGEAMDERKKKIVSDIFDEIFKGEGA